MKQSKKQRIFDDLSRRIREEEWPCGGKLPPMTELCGHYRVSIITLAGAMKLLKDAGMVESHRGRGTFVCWSRDRIFFPQLNDRGRTVEVTHSLMNASPLHFFIMRQLAENFMRVYSDVRIRFVNQPATRNVEDPYLQSIAACDVPCCGEFYWHAIYAKLDALVPLEDLPGFRELRSSLMEQCAYSTADSGGVRHIHALPLFLNLPHFCLLNRQWCESLRADPPRHGVTAATMLRLLRRGMAGNSAGISPLALPLPREWHSVNPYMEFLSQGLPAEEYNHNDPGSVRRILASDRAEQALEYLEDLLHTTGSRICLGKENEYFALGKTGILPFAHSWTLQLIETLNRTMQYHAFAMPPLRGTDRYRPFCTGFSVGIFRGGSSSAQQKKAAWDWLKFLFCRQAQEICSRSMHIPAQKDATSYVEQVAPEIWRLARTALNDALPQPDFVGLRRIYSQLSRPLRSFLGRKINAKECLALMRGGIDL